MADNKKYYYMRLKENFFDTNEMKVLESMQDGYKYSNILLKLYLMSLQSDGKLMLNERIPYNSQMIATITRHSVGDVEKALVLFKDLGLIEILDSGAIYMLDIQKYIGKSSTEADRQREYQRKISYSKEICKKSNKKSTPEIEIEKDIEIEKERETEKRKRVDYQRIVDMYNDTCVSFPKVHSISDARKKAIKARLNTYSVYDFKILFKKAESSDFLKGKNARNWSANFDWLIKDANMAKVLDGNYDGVQAYSGCGASQSDDSTSQKQLAALMERQEQLNAEYAKQKHDEDYF